MKNKVVLAYSGGLDTSFCIKYLTEEKKLLVDAVYVNVGSADEAELKELRDKALNLGANKFEVISKVDVFYQDYIKYLIFGNVLRNSTYPLSVSAERMVQAMAIAEYANNSDAEYIAHGSTDAGNDQVRFDVVFGILCSDKEVITPIRDLKLSREDEIKYLKKHNISIQWNKAKYSINKGLWGTSIGGEETLTSHLPLPDEAYPSQLKNTNPLELTFGFNKGEVCSFNNEEINPVEIIEKLNELGNEFAIGRDIHVGDTIVGIKGRVAFEAPAALMIIKAHQALEKHVLTKWQTYWKDQQANWYGMFLHEAQFLDPVMRNIENFLTDTQKNVTGQVILKLSPYRFEILGIKSKHDLMSSEFGSYGEENKGFSGSDVRGFTKVFSNANRIYNAVQKTIKMIRVGIIGGAGYVAGELIRLLINHPDVEIDYLFSRSKSGKRIDETHDDLIGETNLVFSDGFHYDVEVIFLCMGHGESDPFVKEIPSDHPVVIIDLSTDFRLNRQSHDFVYGLPELNIEAISKANRIANPGCFATAIQLGLLPLIKQKLLKSQVFISGITGATGAGGKPNSTSHFAWRTNNFSIYKPFNHQHLNEINETFNLILDQDQSPELVFIPHRGDFARGIFCSLVFNSDLSLEQLKNEYQQFYKNSPFTIVTDKNPNLKQVVNSNKCLIYLEKNKDRVLVISMIDNLLKGAAGQAIQNMNIRFGLDQNTGLNLKTSAF